MSPEKVAAVVILISVMLTAGLQDRSRAADRCAKNSRFALTRAASELRHRPDLRRTPRARFQTGRVRRARLSVNGDSARRAISGSGGRAKAGGSLGFAAALAFIMPALSIVTIPLMAAFSTRLNTAIEVPYGRLILTLVAFQLVPLLIGYLIADRAPALAAKLKRPFTLVFFLAVVALFIMIGPELIKAVASVYGSRGMLATLVLVVLSIGTGWILGGPGNSVPADAKHRHRSTKHRYVCSNRDRKFSAHVGRPHRTDVFPNPVHRQPHPTRLF